MADEIARTPLQVKDGAIALPTAPGIGIDLDEAALARFPYRGPRQRRRLSPEDERP